jgi:phage gp16-like protein
MGYAFIAIFYLILAIIIAYYIAVGDSFFNKSLRLGQNKVSQKEVPPQDRLREKHVTRVDQ